MSVDPSRYHIFVSIVPPGQGVGQMPQENTSALGFEPTIFRLNLGTEWSTYANDIIKSKCVVTKVHFFLRITYQNHWSQKFPNFCPS